MNTESIVKLFILFGTLYLFMKCLNNQEDFNEDKYDFSKPVDFNLMDGNGVSYNLVSLEQFKQPYQKNIIEHMKVAMPKLVDYNISVTRFNPMPMFLIRALDMETYINSEVYKFKVKNVRDGYAFTPRVPSKITAGEYLYMDPLYNMIVYSSNYSSSRLITVNKNDIMTPSNVKPLAIDKLNLFTFDMNGPTNIKFTLKQ
jgi:hypothetical protein